jgi:hypothetical protein
MVEKRILGADVKALVHHVQLNESGWIDRAIGRAIKFMLWLNDKPLSQDYLVENQADVGLNHLTKLNISGAVILLCNSGEVLEIPPQKYKLSEVERKSIGEAVIRAEETERFVKTKVLTAASKLDGTITLERGEELWERFHRQFIVPFIQETGARSYELITGSAPENRLRPRK